MVGDYERRLPKAEARVDAAKIDARDKELIRFF
jgi:hypothetical protein